MQEKETIRVFIKAHKGKTVCICTSDDKRCSADCEEDIVERDRFRGWKTTFVRDKYGKCRDSSGGD